jgi:hypothetical protein
MKSLLTIIKYIAVGVGGLVALVVAAAIYGAATPNADIEAKRAADARRAEAQAKADANAKAAREAGERMGEKIAGAIQAVEDRREARKKIYDAGFGLGKKRAESRQKLPDLSALNSLARDIIESYGLTSEQGELEQQFRAGYGKGFITGK